MVNDKKMTLMMLVVAFIFGMVFFWVVFQLFIFLIRASELLPYFLDEGEEIIKGELMFSS